MSSYGLVTPHAREKQYTASAAGQKVVFIQALLSPMPWPHLDSENGGTHQIISYSRVKGVPESAKNHQHMLFDPCPSILQNYFTAFGHQIEWCKDLHPQVHSACLIRFFCRHLHVHALSFPYCFLGKGKQ